jgi:hypothetical protein
MRIILRDLTGEVLLANRSRPRLLHCESQETQLRFPGTMTRTKAEFKEFHLVSPTHESGICRTRIGKP